MTPSAALQSDVFCLYLFIIIGTVCGAGILLAILALALKQNLKSLWPHYRSWLIMVVLGLACVFVGRWATILFFVVVAAQAFKEFAKATGLYRDWWYICAVYAGIIAVVVVCLVRDPVTGNPGWYDFFTGLPAYVVAALLIIPILRNRTEGQLQSIALSIVGFVYIGWMFGHLAFLANSRNAYGYLFYLVFAVEVNDAVDYYVGKFFGRHQLCSKVNPAKTWEGALAALAVSMAMPWILMFSFPHFGALQLLMVGGIVGVGGQLGDLSLSVIKQDLGVKDMGALIPGHGGVLDRVTSLIYTAPLFLHTARYFYGLY